MKMIKKIVNTILYKLGLKIIRLRHFDKMKKFEIYFRIFKILEFSGGRDMYLNSLSKLIQQSKSQLTQDLFVLDFLNYKRSGYFVEFGATNGIDLSNTWLLEKEFGWNGILAEPSKSWQHDLLINRSCQIETKAVYSKSNEKLSFLEASSPELSTLNSFRKIDSLNRIGRKYEVETISLLDLLIKYDAPHVIDYLSIDTEGSEFDILSNFDFDNYKFKVITVEHNFTEQREKINQLLSSKGYRRVLKEVSLFDDWYVLKEL
jgi:FkbM family methyltransferase